MPFRQSSAERPDALLTTQDSRVCSYHSRRVKILHLAAGNRWTGAAAPAFAEVEALREAGVDAHYAYVGGYKLEKKLAAVEFAHPLIEKAQNPAAFFRSVGALADLGKFDFVHAHLTYDHLLARVLARRTGSRVARTFHSRRVLRSDPFARLLNRRTALFCAINDAFLDVPPLRGRDPLFTPPPLDHRQFTPEGDNVRSAYGIDASAPLAVVIGKLSAGRGFETALHAFREIRDAIPDARMMVIGHGEHRPALESLAAQLAIANSVVWAGYHEDDLAAHYRAADVLLFTERGSDEGHRAVLEAMACGVPPVVAPLDGMEALLRPFERRLIAPERSAAAIAGKAVEVFRGGARGLGSELVGHSRQFSFASAAARLLAAYERARARS